MAKDPNALSEQQKLFIKEYLVDLNATQAMIRAGYSKAGADVEGCKMMKKPKIANAIQAQMDKRAAKIEVTAEYALRTVLDCIERCKQAEPVRDKEGMPTGEYKFDAGAVLKGAELLMKHLNILGSSKVEVSGKVTLEQLVAASNQDEE